MNSVSNQRIQRIQHEKRNCVPDTKPKKLQKIDGMVHASFRHDPCLNSGQSETRPVNVAVLPLSSDKEVSTDNIRESIIYKVDQKFLPLDAPTSLKFIRAVLVAEKTRFNVTVTFPSMTSLQSYFGRAPVEKAEDHMTGTLKLYLAQDQMKKETCIGTKPELDENFNMTPKVAERVLYRPASRTEYLHQGHLWSFWVVKDLEEVQYRRLSGGKGNANDRDMEDEKGELGAAKALTQLIPENALIISPGGNQDVNEGSSKYGSEGPVRSRIRWGIRSLRKASFGNRSGNETFPNSCDTGSKDSNRKGRERNFGRKTLDVSDHLNAGRTRIIHDLIPTERSSSMHSRREEKSINIAAVQCPSSKADNSKHIRSNIILKLPKDMKGRWASERYKSAQLKLIDIMHERGAAPGKPILRPALREEARKDIGDTGLLDHLLKHMTDTVVTNGERFRRRHNAEGAMEYWLEDASLMEIRKAAGIEDPSWIPPPGWKPGDALPGRGEYGYGCFNRDMTPAEVAAMKRLKDAVESVTSDLQSLSLRVKRWRSREISPEIEGLQNDKHETATDSVWLIPSNIEIKDVAQERRSTGKILKETKSQLETDLSEVQKSIALMQGYVDYTVAELGFTQGEDTQLLLKQVNSGDAESRSIGNRNISVRDTTLAPVGPSTMDRGKRNCFAKTSSTADMSSEESDSTTRRKEVAFAISVGNEPNRLGLSQSNSGLNMALPNRFKVCNTSGIGRFARSTGMIVPQAGAFGVWAEAQTAEDDLSPGTLLPAVNTPSCLGHNAETSREDASARVISTITGSDDKNQFRPYFQHHINFFLPSAASEVNRKYQNTVNPDHFPEGSRVKEMTAGKGNFQPYRFHEATHQLQPQALASVHRETAQAHDGLTILSFAAGCEAIDNVSQKHGTALDIPGVLHNRLSDIANLKCVSSSVLGSVAGPASVVVYPKARKCRTPGRTPHHIETNNWPTGSITSSGCNSLSAVAAVECDRSDPFSPSAPVANHSFDEIKLANPRTDISSRNEHLIVTSVSKETPIVHMPKNPSTNLSLTSRGPSNNGSPCTSGSLAEPPSAVILSNFRAAQARAQEGGSYCHGLPRHGLKSTDHLERSQQADGHGLEERQAISKKTFLKAHSSMQKSFPEIVVGNFGTQSSTNHSNSSTWLGLAPPTSDNLH